MIPEDSIPVLNCGYVRLVDVLGSDLTVANAARVSFNKAKSTLDEKDIKLINFLAKHDHTSPFRHAMLQFEVYVPLMVARQHWKYIVGSSMQDNMMAWNESSRRYVTEEPEFYFPDKWRSAPADKKQGSGEPLSEELQAEANGEYIALLKAAEATYKHFIDKGMAPEQARMFLPAYGLMIRYYWTASLQGVCHFLKQRLNHAAQSEIQELAKGVEELAYRQFPVSVEALLGTY